MTKFRKNIILTVILSLVLIAGAFAYRSYILHEVYEGNSRQLLAAYDQVKQVFTIFTQRNWNVLADWDANLQYVSAAADPQTAWSEFAGRTNNWQYSDFYLFNEEGEYLTAGGSQGTEDIIKSTFSKMYERNEAVISEYTDSEGAGKVVYAVPLSESFTLDEITYTGAAVSYDANVIEDMISKDVYSEQSSCYLINSHGDVLLSLKAGTRGEKDPGNLFIWLGSEAKFLENTAAAIQYDIQNVTAGSAEFRAQMGDYYLICQPAGINDWSIIGIVQSEAVDYEQQRIMDLTVLVIAALSVCLLILIIRLVTLHGKFQLKQQEALNTALQEQKNHLNSLFFGMAQLVDCYVTVDLANDSYEYYTHQNKEPSYPTSGRYQDLVDIVNRKYVVLSDAENIKLSQLLNQEHLQKVLRKGKGILKIEYGGRMENIYKIMNVIAVEWNADDSPRKIMLIVQDIGKRYELENLANTDGLTGLFNERCFSSALRKNEERKLPFTLYYLDLDHFKPVNDTYGHDMGDKLLKEVAGRLMNCIRNRDFAFRIGGDEFAVILNADMDSSLCETKKKQIVQAIVAPYEIDNITLQIGVSCGYAVYPKESDDTSQIRIIADRRMYVEKEKNHQLSS